jgi:hypothetical protein
VRDGKAALSVLFGLLALGALAGAAAAARYSDRVGLREAAGGIPLGLILSVLAIRLGRQATERHQRSLGGAGGRISARIGRFLGSLALLVSATAILAVGVYAVLAVLLD